MTKTQQEMIQKVLEFSKRDSRIIGLVMFANVKWLKTGDLYKYCFVLVAIILILTMICGLAWAKIIY